MKNFFRLMLILLCLSSSVSAHADVLTTEDFYVRVIRQQAESGLIEEWSTEQKIQLVNWMAEAGIDVDDAKLLSLNNKNTSADDKETIAETLIEESYGPGRGGAITILDIMGKTKGDYETWTVEDKAWLYQQYGESGFLLVGDWQRPRKLQALCILWRRRRKHKAEGMVDFVLFHEGTSGKHT